MPPRKKAKSSVRAASTPAAEDASIVADSPSKPDSEPYDILTDPWTDEQETSLFKGIMRWKPAGIHKHFRMIALSAHLRFNGYDPKVDKHTSIPGIWAKLRTLYDLDVIDERENSFEYEDQNKYVEFHFPIDDYFQEETLKRTRRDNSDAPSSPPQLRVEDTPPPETAPKKRKRADTAKPRASTVEDTDAASTPTHSPPKSIRGGRGAGKAVGRMKAESRSRQESKDTTADEDEDAEKTEETGEDEEDDAEEDEVDAKPSKATKSKAGAATTRKSKRKR